MKILALVAVSRAIFVFEAARNTNMHWNAVMEGVIRISHLIELVYSQKIPKKLVKKILWYYLVTIPNYV